MRRPAAALAVSIALAASLACGGARPKPNIVVIVVDSLGTDALGAYGGKEGASPTIDRLAGEGVRFERAIAQAPWNVPSVSSLLTSAYPWQHGRGMSANADGVTTLAEVLSKNGYRTAAFTEAKWPLLERGFGKLENTAEGHLYGDPEASSAAKTVQATLDWIGQQGTDPYFALVHTYEAHSYFLGKPHHRAFARSEQSGYK